MKQNEVVFVNLPQCAMRFVLYYEYIESTGLMASMPMMSFQQETYHKQGKLSTTNNIKGKQKGRIKTQDNFSESVFLYTFRFLS